MSKRSKYSNVEAEYRYLTPRTFNQRKVVESIRENTISLIIGPPGCGKTLLALQAAIHAYKDGEVDKIYYVRNNPVNKLGSKGIGFLPGTAQEKLAPLVAPIVDNIYQICNKGKADYILGNGIIEGITFEDLRGRSFQKSFIISDESQNCPPIGIYTVLTRIGNDSKLVLLGDSHQKDSTDSIDDGLTDAWNRLANIPDIGRVSLGIDDIFRNKLIKDIIKSYRNIL